MKKAAVYVLVFSFVLFGQGCKKKAEDVAREGLVNFLGGEVFIIKKDGRVAAKVGDVVKQGMKVETGRKSFVDIYFGENAVKVLESTVIEVKQLITNVKSSGEQTELFVEKGQVLSRISKKLSKEDSYKITTPTTVASVRGTDFMVSEEGGRGKVACLDGKVAVKEATQDDSKYVEVNGGQEVEVDPGKPLSVRELSESNKKMIRNILKDIKDMQKDIRKRFEEEREKIRQQVKDEKAKNKEMVQKQRDEDKQRVEDQKAMDKANIEAIKGNIDSQKEEIKGDIGSKSSEMKGDVSSQKDEAKKDIEGVKPEVKKFGIDVKKPDMGGIKPESEK